MSTPADVLVVGGGIAGCTVAIACARRGMHVTLLEPSLPDAASRPSAGLLAPSLGGLSAPMRVAALAARDFYPAYLAALEERTGIHVTLDRSGIIEVDPSGNGMPGTPLDASALRELEPALAPFAHAVIHALDGSVDNVCLMDALEREMAASANIDRVHAAAAAIATGANAVTITTDSGRVLSAARVVIAAGAWCDHVAGLPRTIPVRPLRGQLARMAASPVQHVIAGAGGYLVPRGASVVVGATSDDVGFELGTSSAGLSALRRTAECLVPALQGASVTEHWSALRPMSADGLPILGRDPTEPGVLYACGYSRNGVLFAPWAAELLAKQAFEPEPLADLSPFGIGRFTKGEIHSVD